MDIANEFSTSSVSLTTLTKSLPFLKDDELVPYVPTVDVSGNVTVIAGSCSAGASSTEVWRFYPDPTSDEGNGTWTSYQTSAESLGTTAMTGTNFLGNAVSFSANVDGDASELDYYVFGGMCPFSNSTADTWQSAANYSNTMLSFIPSGEDYDISPAANRAPPVAEAGFSMTGLTPTYSMKTSTGSQTQQQDFLLLGGHTQSAFLNMSQIALYSLPQESWTFLGVQQPSSAKTDLALSARSTATTVEPRSGHTAVLSEDGTEVIVFGGWVGDVSTPAVPQLAILHLGAEYGGDESEAWTWTIPSQTGSGLAAGAGIYGHGATLLPGNVMMIAGGYSIPASSSKRRSMKRTASDAVYLYNTTTGAWVDTYNPPASVIELAAMRESSSSSGPLSTTSEQTGLGVGLGVGVLVLLVLIFFYFWYARRLRRAREERERELLAHSPGGSYTAHNQPFLDNDGLRGGDPWSMADDPDNPDGMTQAGSTGLFVNAASPTRGSRKPVISRPYNYEPAPRYDESRTNRGSGGIHPILERQDEDGAQDDDNHVFATPLPIQRLYQAKRGYETSPERRQRELQDILSRTSVKNPFQDPPPNPLGSHPVSPISPTREGTVRRVTTQEGRADSPTRRPLTAETEGSMNWTIVDEPPENSNSTGRSSPTRTDDRTSSTLSEQSHRSAISSNSITRTMSTRTGKLLVAALAKDSAIGTFGEPSTREERSSTMSSSGGRRSPFRFYAQQPRTPTYEARVSMHHPAQSTDSFKTARSSFAHLQTEGEALLGGRPKDDPYHRALAAHPSTAGKAHLRDDGDIPLAPQRRKQGWVGSLKRALTAMSTDRTFSFTGGSEILTAGNSDESTTRTSSPTRPNQFLTGGVSGEAPRRAVSDGGELLRHKRGEKDWSEDNKTAFRRYRDDPDPGDWGEISRTTADAEGEGEWDVEGEGGKRDVQVMFTVPKTRLRVVNADVERASLRSASDGAISRSESLKSLRAKRSRTEWEKERVMLPKTAEEHADEIFGPVGKKKMV